VGKIFKRKQRKIKITAASGNKNTLFNRLELVLQST